MRRSRWLGWAAALSVLGLGCGSRSLLEPLADESYEVRGGAQSAGGSAGLGGGGGTSGGAAVPATTQRVDLLLVIDNSSSMQDKQGLLASAIPGLLARWITPRCVDDGGEPTGEVIMEGERCTRGAPEFAPITDLHAGIITTSLGSHGGDTCLNTYENDRAELLPLVRAMDPAFPYQTWDESGFVAWDPSRGPGRHEPPGEDDLERLTTNVANQLASAGENGCGFEGSLESWYRFLIDPDPPTFIPVVTDPSEYTKPFFPKDVADNPVLVERSRFLRDDSALVIVMLTDENDCSIMDEAQGWLVGTRHINSAPFVFPSGTSACDVNPNDPCCGSCYAEAAPGCPSAASDPACASAQPPDGDNNNLRCFDQRRRFGLDLLYPLTRYLDGLTKDMVPSRRLDPRGQPLLVRNPLFPPGGRRKDQVFLAGILGVPWQDLATEQSLDPGAALEYLSAAELTAKGRWSLVIGDAGDAANPPAPPRDKLMFETPRDRSELFGAEPHPLLGRRAALAPASSKERTNAINGHETNNYDAAELQYACIFELEQPRNCGNLAGCDCRASELDYNRAICDGTTQRYGKAYPSVRQLRLLSALAERGNTAIAASICPKSLDGGADDPGFGYTPAISAIVRAVSPALAKP